MQCLLLNYDRNSESGGGALNHPSIYGAIIRRTGYGRIVFVKPRGSRSAPGLSLSLLAFGFYFPYFPSPLHKHPFLHWSRVISQSLRYSLGHEVGKPKESFTLSHCPPF